MRMIINRKNAETSDGYVITSQRQLILDAILKSCGPLDAKKLFRIVSQKDETVSLATVYRSLKLFKEKGIIDEHRFGRNCYCYEIKQSMEHQHIICKCCGKVVEFVSPLISEIINRIKNEKGFNIEKVELCIQGICDGCQKAIKDQ
jgi:Fur family ferric uptake transcriptional regulator